MSGVKNDKCLDTVIDLILAKKYETVDIVLRDRTLRFRRVE